MIEELNYIADSALATAMRRSKVSPDTSFQDWINAIQSEVDELAAASNNPSCHIPHFTERQEEAIDIMITVLSFLASEKVNIVDLLTEKTLFNNIRKD